MLFFLLGVLIFYSLVTFGAVLPNAWLLLTIVLSIVTAGCLISAGFRRNAWSSSLTAAFVLLLLSLALFRWRLAAGILFGVLAWVAASQQGEEKTLRFLKLLVILGIGEAILALTQYFVSPGWIFGYINQAYPVSGTLINHNHFAGLLEMLIPVTFGLAYMTMRRSGELARSYLYLLAGALMSLALIVSASRMGILSFATTVIFLGLLLRVRKSNRRLALGFTLTILGLVAAGALWVGIDVVIQRYSFLLGEDAILREGRLLVYRDTLQMIGAHPLGIGMGNFQDRFRQYQTFRPDLLFDHAHNDYLETAAEWGIPIALGFWIFIVFAWIRAIRIFISPHSAEHSGILLACIGAVFAILVHSLADFNLQIPSNAMLFFAFIGFSLSIPFDKNVRERSAFRQ